MQVQRKTLTQLSIPICFETLFYMLSGMVDTLMLSSVSDQAVGAVGTANTYISVFIIMFGVISSGMVAVMTQNIGAGKPGIAYQARQLGLIFNAVIAVLMSVFLAVFSGNILKMVSIAPALFDSANTYLRIVGGACFLNALIPIYSSYLRVFGYTKQSLWASIIGNVINFILNAVFLFVMNWGVMGVATATVISRIINLIIVATMGAVLIKAKDSPERIAPGKILGQIIKIGFPSACETALYNIAMTLVVRFMNQMDADKPKKEPKKRSPRKSAAAGKKTKQALGAVAASSVEVPVQADDFVGQSCPLCGKGTVIKGKTAYGCSEWKSGCTFRKPFE